METAIDASATKSNRVEFGARFGAWVIDLVILTILCFVLAPILGGAIGALTGAATTSSMGGDDAAAALGGMMGMFAGIVIMIPFIYFVYYLIEGFTGYTLGKMILGIRVGAADGKQAGVSSLLTRFVVKSSGTLLSILAAVVGVAFIGTLGSIVGLVIFIGCFFVLGANRQSFHDMASKTAVFKKGDLA